MQAKKFILILLYFFLSFLPYPLPNQTIISSSSWITTAPPLSPFFSFFLKLVNGLSTPSKYIIILLLKVLAGEVAKKRQVCSLNSLNFAKKLKKWWWWRQMMVVVAIATREDLRSEEQGEERVLVVEKRRNNCLNLKKWERLLRRI